MKELPIDPTVGPIRVAYIVHAFHAGGLERSVSRLVDGLDRQRFQPLVVCLDTNGNAANWIESEDVPILALNKGSGNSLSLPWRLANVFRSNEVDIAHSHNWGTLVETAIACRLVFPRVRHIHAERGTVLGQLKQNGLRYAIRKRMMQTAVHLADVVLSNAVATASRVATSCGIANERIRVIANGVSPAMSGDVDIRSARVTTRACLKLSDDAVLVGSVGRLVAVKDLPTALHAVAHAVKRGANLHYVLVGDGPERDRLANTAKNLDIEHRIHFAGEQAEVGPWFAAMDICLNTSVSEGMSQTLVEAMAMGVPLVVTDVGDSRLLVDRNGPCGRVAAASSASEVGDHLYELASDRLLRNALGARARNSHRLNHSSDMMLSSYEALYVEVANRRILAGAKDCNRDGGARMPIGASIESDQRRASRK